MLRQGNIAYTGTRFGDIAETENIITIFVDFDWKSVALQMTPKVQSMKPVYTCKQCDDSSY